MKEAQALVIGTEFRPNTGIGTKVIQFAETGNTEPLWNLIGDYFASYTYPASIVKDAYGQFDTRSSYRPETRDATVSLIDTSFSPTGTIALSTLQRFTRFLPDFDDNSPVVKSLGNLFSTSSELTFQTMHNKGPSGKEDGYDPIRFDVFGKGPLRIRNPLLKQLTGFEGTAPNNPLKKEITRLQLDPFNLYNPYTEKNTPLTLLTEQMLQGNLAANTEAFIKEDVYLNAPVDAQKDMLEKRIKLVIADTKDYATDILDEMGTNREYDNDFFAYSRGKYRAMSKKEKEYADLGFEELIEDYGYAEVGSDFSSVREHIRDEYKDNPAHRDSMDALLIHQYIQAGKRAKRSGKVISEAK
jgi:hypothetical protein